MDGPVYFYFRISNFYQNHRVYVADRADNQARVLLLPRRLPSLAHTRTPSLEYVTIITR